MANLVPVAAPELPELEPCELPDGGELDELVVSESLVEHHGRAAIATRQIRVPWTDLVGSVASLAAALGVAVESEA